MRNILTIAIACLIMTNASAQNATCVLSAETFISLYNFELTKSDIEQKLDCYSYGGIKGMAQFRVFKVVYQIEDSNYYDKIEVPISDGPFTKQFLSFETSNYETFTLFKERFLKYGFELVNSTTDVDVYGHEDIEIQTILFQEQGRYIIVFKT